MGMIRAGMAGKDVGVIRGAPINKATSVLNGWMCSSVCVCGGGGGGWWRRRGVVEEEEEEEIKGRRERGRPEPLTVLIFQLKI